MIRASPFRSIKTLLLIQHAIGQKFKKNAAKQDHWLDHASDKFDQQLIKDIKQVFHVLVLYLPIPIFWALYDQQVWTMFN